MPYARAAADREHERERTKWVWLVPLGVIAVLVALYFVSPTVHTFVNEAYSVLSSGEQQRIERWVDGFGGWAFAAVLALMLLQTVAAFLPSLLTMVVAVVSFGPWIGGIVAWGGLLLAAALGYGIGRSLGVASVDRLLGSKTERTVERFLDRYGVWAIVAARVSPVLSTDAVSMAAGLVRMKFLPFIAATGAGTLPLTVLVAWLGAEVDRLQTGLIWISVLSVAAFVAYVLYDRHRSRRENA